MLRERIRLAQGQEIIDWQLMPRYTISRAGSFTTVNQLANQILLNKQDDQNDIVQAAGLYVDGELVAVTDDGPRLRAYLDSLLAAYKAKAPEGAQVGFVRAVECDPERTDVYFASSVIRYDELIERLSGNVVSEFRLKADGQKNLSEIARQYSLPKEMLLNNNPQFMEMGEDAVPDEGAELLIRSAQPFLQVQATVRVKNTEELPFEEIELAVPNRPKGERVLVQQGEAGWQEVWYDCVYIDGLLDKQERVENLTFVLNEPVAQLIEVGTMEAETPAPDFTLPSGGYGGAYLFPVPESPYSSRGISPNHRGLDINAAANASILACEGGVVKVAEWHYSYGNYIVIEHPGGVETLYAHCNALYVVAGQQVAQGQLIGAVGSTGSSTGNHCHLEVHVNGALVDPVSYVGYPYG
jgi:murein DD-endopeptidase MepM/ murein hydrolase activator NlpD